MRELVTRSGKAVAAIVSSHALALLEALEERGDVGRRRARRAGKRGFIPLEKMKAKLAL